MRLSYSTPTRGGMVAARTAGALAVLLALSACGSSGGGDSAGGQPPQQPPVPVDVAVVQPHSVDVYSEYPGRVQGKRTVQVLARVQGVLEKKHYTEGQVVKQGQLLYSIDPKPFQVTVDQRKAELASAQATLDQARRQWGRVSQLYKANAASQAERDQGLSGLQTGRAAVQQARANLDSAQIDLGYTQVNAPLTGVTSLRETDEGSLVSNGTRLTTITQLDPVYVLFALPENDAIARKKALSEMGAQSSDEATRKATIVLSDGKPFPVKGTVDFTQSTINPETGTVQLRAVVKNKSNTLMPGRYVRARIRIETLSNAIVIPNAAISSGGQRTQVFVVADGKAKPVTVELGPDVGAGRVITGGLSAGDRVITSGLGQVKPGAPVKIKPNRTANDDDASPSPGAGQEPAMGESGARQDRHSGKDDSALADIEGPSLRLSPREPLQPMTRKHPADVGAIREADSAYAANVDRGS